MNKMIVLTSLALISTSTEGTNQYSSNTAIDERREMVGLSNTQFDRAITVCNVDEIKHFIELGADVNSEDTYGNTPLIMACRYGHEDLVEYLVEHGADVDKKCDEKDLLDIPLEEADDDIVIRLINCAAGVEERHDMIRLVVLHDDLMECVKPDLMDVNMQGEEALLTVLYRNCTKRMTAHIPNCNLGFSGPAPLHCACKNGYEGIVKYLIEHGADVNKENSDGDTPLSVAREEGHENIVEYLTEQGAIDDSSEDSDSDEFSV